MQKPLLVLLTLVLTSCAPPATAQAASSPTPNDAAPTVAPRPVPAEFAEMVARVNEVRESGYDCGASGSFGPAVPLAWNPVLAEAAADHSRDMAENAFFSHTGSNGGDVTGRVEERGYAWSAVGENLAEATPGHFTQQSVVEGWLTSPGHCANLLRPEFREIGAAKETGDLEYWTQVFGTPR